MGEVADNPVDACVEIILKPHEQKLLQLWHIVYYYLSAK